MNNEATVISFFLGGVMISVAVGFLTDNIAWGCVGVGTTLVSLAMLSYLERN